MLDLSETELRIRPATRDVKKAFLIVKRLRDKARQQYDNVSSSAFANLELNPELKLS